MRVRSKILKIRNLPKTGEKRGEIKTKPYGLLLTFLVIGIALLFTSYYVFGIVLVGIFLYYLLFIKNTLLVEFFDTYAVFYLNNGKDECYVLFWNDVKDWQLEKAKRDMDILNIVLKDDTTIALKCLGRKKICKYFKQYAAVGAHKEQA